LHPDEHRHRPTDDLWWGEAWSFDFATAGAGLGGAVRLGLLPNQATCWYWACVIGPGRDPIVVVDNEVPLPRAAALEVRTSGLWAEIIVEEAFEHVSVGAEAFALRLDRPGDTMGLPTPLGLDLGWETDGALVRHADGYDLPCRVVGEVLVADERIELDAVGHRHHTWGVEDWWSTGWTAVSGRLDDGTWFSGRAGPSALAGGDLPTGDRFVTDALDLVVEPVAWAPVAVEGDDGVVSDLVRALCRFGDASGGRRGVGWAEWNRLR
jgi:hypothetical protein